MKKGRKIKLYGRVASHECMSNHFDTTLVPKLLILRYFYHSFTMEPGKTLAVLTP